MPLIKDIFLNDTNYPDSTYTSEWTNLESSSYTVFTVYCSEDCDIVVNWAVDNQFQIFDTDTVSLTGGTAEEIVLGTKASFAQYQVLNIASTPSDLKLQAWFYTDK